MATKKATSSTSQLEIKAPKASGKTARYPLSATQPLLDQSGSCCSETYHASNSAEKKEIHPSEKSGLPMTLSSEKSGCCRETATCETSMEPWAQKQTTSQPLGPTTECKKGPKTRIIIRYDVGFNNTLSLRGKGANLSWDKGILLKNVKPDEWIWETESFFNMCEFKVLINDTTYETGKNHPLSCGASIQYTPIF